jgi:hypothetical protein
MVLATLSSSDRLGTCHHQRPNSSRTRPSAGGPRSKSFYFIRQRSFQPQTYSDNGQSTLKGLHMAPSGGRTLSGFIVALGSLPRVARLRRLPWAIGFNAFGVTSISRGHTPARIFIFLIAIGAAGAVAGASLNERLDTDTIHTYSNGLASRGASLARGVLKHSFGEFIGAGGCCGFNC